MTAATPRRAHWVSANRTTRVPRRHVVLDTEARESKVAGGHRQVWRLGVARYLADEGRREPAVRTERYATPGELWAAVSLFARPGRRTVLWAHNLGYDLRTADAFGILPGLGWELLDVNLARRGCWCRWRRAGATLVMVDSTSVWPLPLAKLAQDTPTPKLPLPEWEDDDEAWYARCERDVEILAAAVSAYLRWLRAADMGCWQLTGAGQSWAAWRHRFLAHKVLAHDDPVAAAAERRAMHTGRCEVWRWGARPARRLDEWDLSLAYCRLARDLAVPTRLRGHGPSADIPTWHRLRRSGAVLADVTLTTDTPTVPARVDGRVCWPVGTFTTTLWDCELAAALADGARVTIGSWWFYRTDPALRSWADWLLAELADDGCRLPVWQRTVLKHWSRALIGRMAVRHSQWEAFADTDDDDVALVDGWDADTGTASQYLRIGRRVLRSAGTVDGDSAVPAICGYVMAACRLRLWEIMRAVGLDRVVYVDTDSLLVDGVDSARVAAVAAAHPEWGLRLKRRWSGYDVRGPRQLVLGASVRYAGVPRDAKRTVDGAAVGEVWESLDHGLRVGNRAAVLLTDRTWRLGGVDHRRAHLSGGLTAARRLVG